MPLIRSDGLRNTPPLDLLRLKYTPALINAKIIYGKRWVYVRLWDTMARKTINAGIGAGYGGSDC